MARAKSEAEPPAETVTLRVLSAIEHDGRALAPGDTLALPAALAQALVLAGAAELDD